MLSSMINMILAWIHIFGSIGWMGATMILVMVISPLMKHLTPQTRSELVLKMYPRLTRYVTLFASIALITGFLLANGMTGGNHGMLSLSNTWGTRIIISLVLSIVAYLVAIGVVIRSVNIMLKIVKNIKKKPDEVTHNKLIALQKRIRFGGITVFFLLLLILTFMVAAARL